MHTIHKLCLSLSIILTVVTSAQQHMYMLQLTPCHAQKAQEIDLLYKGYLLDTRNPSCIPLPEDQPMATFCLVCSDEIYYERDDLGDIESLARVPERPIRWFDITYVPSAESRKSTWHVEERSEHELPHRLPDNTILILADPYELQTVNIQTVVSSHGHNISYITLALEEEAPYARNGIRAMMASLDARSFHIPVRKTERQDQRRRITKYRDLP